jgi:hypothetical protein
MAEMDMGQEKSELSAWDKVSQLAQSGNPQALQEIAQIAEQELQAQQAEMQGEKEQGGGSFEEKLMAAKKAQAGGGENA